MSYMARAAWGLALSVAACAAQAAADPQQQLLHWVTSNRDHQGLPFAIVDKKQARIHVYDGGGVLVASSRALLGASWGDHIVPGVGARAQTGTVRSDERTTPAGRFVSQPGRNLKGEHVVWVDYDSAFAIHRLRTDRSQAARQKRLASDTPRDNRVSLGCVIVPVAFYLEVVQRVLGNGKAVVYVLPETRSLADTFAGA
jgi:primosomal protein N'